MLKKIALLLIAVPLAQISCRTVPTCPNKKLATNPIPLRALWNTVRRMRRAHLLRIWLPRFLNHLLEGGKYLLKEDGEQYIIIYQRDDFESICKLDITEQIIQLSDPNFLKK